MNAFVLVAAGIIVASPAAAFPAPETHFVRVDSIAGLRTLENQRAEFLEGFRQAFRAETLATETRRFGEWKSGAPLANCFRVSESARAREAWTLGVAVRLPRSMSSVPMPVRYVYWTGAGIYALGTISPDGDSRIRLRRTLTLTFSITDPRHSLAPPSLVRSDLVFPLPTSAPEDSVTLFRAYQFPWFEAGRATGLLALEALHRESRDLGPNVRFALADALRLDAGIDGLERAGP